MSLREITLVLATIALAVAGSFVYWNHSQTPPEAHPTPVMDFPGFSGPVPRIAEMRVNESPDDVRGDCCFPPKKAEEGEISAARTPLLPEPQVPPSPIVSSEPLFIPLPPRPPDAVLRPAPAPSRPAEASVIPFVYRGFSQDDAGTMTAFVVETSDSSLPAGRYNLHEEDILFGRFRVDRITPETVELEDLDRAESNRSRIVILKK